MRCLQLICAVITEMSDPTASMDGRGAWTGAVDGAARRKRGGAPVAGLGAPAGWPES